jgi:hypothetical protein
MELNPTIDRAMQLKIKMDQIKHMVLIYAQWAMHISNPNKGIETQIENEESQVSDLASLDGAAVAGSLAEATV